MYHEIDIVGFFEKGCAISHEQKNSEFQISGKNPVLSGKSNILWNYTLFRVTYCFAGLGLGTAPCCGMG